MGDAARAAGERRSALRGASRATATPFPPPRPSIFHTPAPRASPVSLPRSPRQARGGGALYAPPCPESAARLSSPKSEGPPYFFPFLASFSFLYSSSAFFAASRISFFTVRSISFAAAGDRLIRALSFSSDTASSMCTS